MSKLTQKTAEPISYRLESNGLRFSLVALTLLAVACVGRPPLRTYTIARTAIESAKRADGNRMAPHEMLEADESYRRGEFYFRNRDYASAADEFEKAIKNAEQAENMARLKENK